MQPATAIISVMEERKAFSVLSCFTQCLHHNNFIYIIVDRPKAGGGVVTCLRWRSICKLNMYFLAFKMLVYTSFTYYILLVF